MGLFDFVFGGEAEKQEREGRHIEEKRRKLEEGLILMKEKNV